MSVLAGTPRRVVGNSHTGLSTSSHRLRGSPLAPRRKRPARQLSRRRSGLGSILTVGTTALLVAREAPLFEWLGLPLVPVLHALGLPDAELVAPAALAGICEMYITALLVRDAALPARFFVAVLSISQLIFFSAVGPMMLDMFQKVPIRARELVAIFLMRTAILIPVIALLTRLLERAGMLSG